MKKKKEITLADLLGEQTKMDNIVFREEEIEDGFRRVFITLPGEPMPKQSVRHTINRYYQPGTHSCPFCNQMTNHKKGDVVVYRNKTTGMADVITQMYQDDKYEKKKVEYLWMLKSKKPTFKMFEEMVIIEKMDFVFHIPASFSKTKIQELSMGKIFYKTTQPDLPDNLKKLPLDTLSGFIYKYDGLICEERMTRKYYGEIPRIEIVLIGK